MLFAFAGGCIAWRDLETKIERQIVIRESKMEFIWLWRERDKADSYSNAMPVHLIIRLGLYFTTVSEYSVQPTTWPSLVTCFIDRRVVKC